MDVQFEAPEGEQQGGSQMGEDQGGEMIHSVAFLSVTVRLLL